MRALRPLFVLVASLRVLGCNALPPRPPTPVVTPIVVPDCAPLPVATRVLAVDPVAGDDAASGVCDPAATCTPWKTLAHAAETAQPGDRVELATGVYAGAVTITVDGTASAPITFAAASGARATIAGTLTARDRSHLVFAGLSFDSPDAQAWVIADGAAHDLTFVGDAFDSHAPNTSSGAFVGVSLSGGGITMCGNAFGSWLGDMVSADAIDGLAVVHNDFALASAQHALLAVVGHHVLVRGNAFRNPWQRALHIADRSDSDQTEDVVVEGNTFIDGDWRPGTPNPSNDGQFRGGNEVVRLLGARLAFRDNLLVGNHEGDDWPCHGILNFQTFHSSAGIDTRRFAQVRVYGNTFDANATTSIIFYQGAPGTDLTNDAFANNVVTHPAAFAVSSCSDGIPWTTYRFTGNVIPGARLHLDHLASAGVDLETSAAAAPGVFEANLDVEPVYVDATFGGRVAADFSSYGLSHLREAFAAYQLTPTSPGHASAVPLAMVTSTVTDTAVLPVDDVLWFSDGLGLVAGDTIRIGATTAMVLARDVGARTLTLDRPVTAPAGAPVSLAESGTDPGAWLPAP